MEIQFEHSAYLIGLLAVLLLLLPFSYVLRWKKKSIRKIGDEKLVKELIAGYSPRQFLNRFILAALALALIVLGSANLRAPGQMANIRRQGVDVVIALDVSKSMLADDIKPSRLERARELVYRLLDETRNDRVGLVVFAGRAYLQMPLTTDHGAARMFVQTASPDLVPTQGTVIADALKMSYSAFNSQDRKFKSIILITDGEDHDPEAMKMIKDLADNGVIVNTVGIGSVQGAPILDPATGSYKKDENGNTVVSRLNEEELKQLAAGTRGVYVHYQDTPSTVDALLRRLASIQPGTIDDNAFRDFRNYFQWFLGLALLLLLTEFIWPERSWKKA